MNHIKKCAYEARSGMSICLNKVSLNDYWTKQYKRIPKKLKTQSQQTDV